MRAALLAILTILAALVLAACESKAPNPPVVVYATGAAGSELDDLFAQFAVETQIPVSVIWGDSATNTDNLINNADDSADVLITSNVADIWRAADEGVLRPIRTDEFASVETTLKDPDGFWAAIEIRQHAIAIANGDIRPLVGDFDALANPDLRGRVCLSTSELPINRSLVAMLINDRGAKPTERLVRLWIQNLAAAPFASQDALITALQDGACDYGIVEWRPDIDDLLFFIPEPSYMDIDGIGVARHARQPDSAQRLVGWLLKRKNIRISGVPERQPVGVAGWRDEEAGLLAERAGYH